MTWTAVVTEVAEHMIGIRRLGKPGLMALVAISKMQLIVAIHMARLTRCRNVSTGQREECRVVIKRRRLPHCCTVALRAIVTEVPRYVIRVRRLLKLLLMTLVAIRVMQLVIAIHMARLTRCRNVSTRRREERRVMIECCWTPPCG